MKHQPGWDESKDRGKAKRKAQNQKAPVQFATLMDLCHLKHSALAEHQQKYKGPVVVRGEFQRRRRVQSCVHSTRSIRVSHECSKRCGHTLPSTRNGWRSERCSCLHQRPTLWVFNLGFLPHRTRATPSEIVFSAFFQIENLARNGAFAKG